jgi:hypothetical protein
MKTRQEMIYDFMVALASNPNVINDMVYIYATRLTDTFLENAQ